jgi:hypothetical protein
MPTLPDDAAVFIRIVWTSCKGDRWELTLGRSFGSVLKFVMAAAMGASLAWSGLSTSSIVETLSRLWIGSFR